MIKIERGCLPQDTKMDQQDLSSIEKSINQGEKPDIPNLWKDKRVKDFLDRSQYGKCCYCERKRDTIETDVEHFRPKKQVKESTEHSGYWWLAYDWDNLLLSCKKCNNRKRNQFPLQDEQKRAFCRQDDLTKEKPFLINPLTEDPEEFIKYDIPENDKEPLMIKAIGKNERAQKTVDELTGINDKEVLMERAEHFESCYHLYELFTLLQNNLEKQAEKRRAINNKMSTSSRFAGMARFYFKNLGLLNY